MESSVPILLAFLAGLLTFASPCLLPIVPAYLGYLSGTALTRPSRRRATLAHAALFVLGFSVVLVALGASLGLIGGLAHAQLDLVRKLGGLVVILLGLNMAGLLRIEALSREVRFDLGKRLGLGYPTSFAMGLFFSLGWTPCVGPTLAAILVLASTSSTVWYGAGLLAIYSAGLGIPFLLTASLLEPATRFLQRVGRFGRVVPLVSGALMVGMGLLLFTDQLQRLSALFGYWTPFNI